jgi:hypothetical protein
MWSNFVSISDTFATHLETSFSEGLTAHPMLIASMGALGMGLVVTVWAESRMQQLGILQARTVDGGVPTWLRR